MTLANKGLLGIMLATQSTNGKVYKQEEKKLIVDQEKISTDMKQNNTAVLMKALYFYV